MAAEPQVRALTSHVALQHIATMPAALRDAILRDAGDIQTARDAFQFSWIPFGVQVRILDAMRRHQSPEGWKASQRALMHGYLDKPVLRGLLDTAIRMLGLSVSSLARWTPRAFDALFKNAGTLTFAARGASEGSFSLDGFPTELMKSGTFLESLQAAFEVIFVLAKVVGTVEIIESDAERGHAAFALRWSGDR